MEEQGMGPEDRLRALFGMLRDMSNESMRYEPLAVLSEEQQKEWRSINKMHEDSDLLEKESRARADLFWVGVRRALGQDKNRESLKIEDGMVYGNVKEEATPPPDLPRLE